MNLNYSQLISRIEAELSEEYWPGSIKWADENHNNAWSGAIDRFDRALTRVVETSNYHFIELESKIYKNTILDLMKKYKQHKKLDDANEFLKSISIAL